MILIPQSSNSFSWINFSSGYTPFQRRRILGLLGFFYFPSGAEAILNWLLRKNYSKLSHQFPSTLSQLFVTEIYNRCRNDALCHLVATVRHTILNHFQFVRLIAETKFNRSDKDFIKPILSRKKTLKHFISGHVSALKVRKFASLSRR